MWRASPGDGVLLSDGERRGGLDSRVVSFDATHLNLGGTATHLDAVPVLAGEGVLGLLLEALLALGQSLVPAPRVSAIGNPPDTRGRLDIVRPVPNSIIRGGATYLPTAILTSSYVNGGTDVLLG